MKRILLALIVVMALISAPVSAAAGSRVTVLGDSIATGFGLKGYAVGAEYDVANFGLQIARAAGLTPKAEYLNLAVNGMDTHGLFALLGEEKAAAGVAKCDSCLISIGGNDVLGPALELMKTALGLKADAPNEQLVKALKETPDALEIITRALYAGKDRFVGIARGYEARLARLMTLARRINPRMDIYILSIYNPLDIPALAEAGAFMDELGDVMNESLTKLKAEFGYQILPVSESFRRNTSVYTNIGSFDVHPSQAGHNLIFRLASAAMNLNSQASVKSIKIKKATLKLAQGASAALKFKVSPASAGEAVWSSDNENVVSVDQAGGVTAVGAGATYVWAKLKSNPRIADRCKVTVTGGAVETVSFTARPVQASNAAAKNGAIEIIPVGGSGLYDISLDGGKSFIKRGVAGNIKLGALKCGEFAVLVADSQNAAAFSQKTVVVGYKLPKPRLFAEGGMRAGLRWNGMGVSYEVWRQESAKGAFEMIGVCNEAEFTDYETSFGSVVRYRVRAIGSDGAKSAFSNTVKIKLTA